MRCIAIDDEPLALEVVKGYAEKIPFLSLEATFDNPVDALAYLKGKNIDLIFLDIQMERLTGIEFLNVLTNRPMVIMTTAYDQYAIRGFEMEVEDYLLKPFSFERFLKGVNRAYDRFKLLGRSSAGDSGHTSPEKQKLSGFIFLKVGFELIRLELTEILYIEGQSDYLNVVTSGGSYLTLHNFADFESALPGHHFARVHRSYLVSIRHITKIEGTRLYIGQKSISISNSYKVPFFELIGQLGLTIK